MEFVNNTLYAGVTLSGSETVASLATVNTTSGVISIVGIENAFPYSCTGLAYDGMTMYGVTGPNFDYAKLYVVELATGAASEVGTITDPNTAPNGLYLSNLEFDDDGTLFTIPPASNQFEWPYLYSIDPLIGRATVSTGLDGLPVLAITNPSGDVGLLVLHGA